MRLDQPTSGKKDLGKKQSSTQRISLEEKKSHIQQEAKKIAESIRETKVKVYHYFVQRVKTLEQENKELKAQAEEMKIKMLDLDKEIDKLRRAHLENVKISNVVSNAITNMLKRKDKPWKNASNNTNLLDTVKRLEKALTKERLAVCNLKNKIAIALSPAKVKTKFPQKDTGKKKKAKIPSAKWKPLKRNKNERSIYNLVFGC